MMVVMGRRERRRRGIDGYVIDNERFFFLTRVSSFQNFLKICVIFKNLLWREKERERETHHPHTYTYILYRFEFEILDIPSFFDISVKSDRETLHRRSQTTTSNFLNF